MFPRVSNIISYLGFQESSGLFDQIYTYGFFFAVASLFFYCAAIVRLKASDVAKEIHQIIFYIFVLFGIGILGSLLFSVIVYNKTGWRLNSLGMIWGFTVFGLIVPLKGWKILNLLTPILLFSLGLIKIGCHLSGDGCWGEINTKPKPSWWVFPNWAWSYNFPHNTINYGLKIPDCDGSFCMVLPFPVYPTALYDAVFYLFLGVILALLKKRRYNFIAFVGSLGIYKTMLMLLAVQSPIPTNWRDLLGICILVITATLGQFRPLTPTINE